MWSSPRGGWGVLLAQTLASHGAGDPREGRTRSYISLRPEKFYAVSTLPWLHWPVLFNREAGVLGVKA